MQKRILLFIVFITLIFLQCKVKQPIAKLTTSIYKHNVNAFLFNFLEGLDNQNNYSFSPLSLWTASAMVYVGAESHTKKQFQTFFGFSENVNQHKDSCRLLLDNLLLMKNKNEQFSFVSGVWHQQQFEIKKTFKQDVQAIFDTPWQSVDFIDNSNREQTRVQINDWAEKNTNGLIKELINQGFFSALTRLVIANALYFKGEWKESFEEELTITDDFFVSSKEVKKAKFMRKSGDYEYAKGDGFQLLDIPFANEDLSMIIVLPDEGENTPLTEGLFYSLLTQKQKQLVYIKLPPIKSEFNMDLSSVFIKLGVKDAFSGSADFSGITGNKDLHISSFAHSCKIELNERGVEAAAASAIVMSLKSAPVSITNFTANRPFYYFLMDKKTNFIIIAGWYKIPV
jgi:serpin B